MFPKRDGQDDRVGLERILQRLGDDRGSNRPCLRRQRLGRPATCDGDFDVLTGKGVGEGLAYLAESYNCVAHMFSFGLPNPTALRIIEWSAVKGECVRFGLNLREATVNGEFAGGHEAAVVRREKGRRRPDLRRIGHALERSHRGVDLLALHA